MKRRVPLPRPSKPLKRSAIRRKPPVPRGDIVGYIWRRDLGPCVVCPFEGGTCAGQVQAHHVVSQEALRKRGFATRLMDLRNRLPVCEHRHDQHTKRFKPIPREVLPAAAFEFADEIGLGWYLDRFYPSSVAEEAAA